MPSSKPKSSSKQSHQATKAIIAVVAAIVLAIAGYTAYDSYLDYQDKQRFETVRASVKQLHGRLQAAAAPGVEWEMEVFCSQGSVKFQEALKSCFVKTETNIDVKSSQQARALIRKYRPVFKAAPAFLPQNNYSSDPPFFPRSLSSGSSGAGYRDRETNMVCGSLFLIDNEFEGEITTKRRNLEVSFSCNGRARELHYSERSFDGILQESSD